jgi:MFS family permease
MSMADPRDLGNRLSELEPQSHDLRERYEQALENVLERKLSPLMKLFVGVVGVMAVGIAVFLGYCAITHPELPALARLGFVAGVAFALAWAALSGWTLRKGKWHGKLQPKMGAALAWLFAVLLVTLFLMLAPEAKHPYQATIAVLAGLAILIGAGVQLLGTSIQQSELRTREALLRMEYRLAELAEEIAKDRHP